MDADLYLRHLSEALPRLLNLLDRNPASPTYGSFDRAYWLHRRTDFSRSTAQMSARTLALLFCTPGTSFYANEIVREWALAALKFTLTLQHRDGSFDEWYPNERGWAGPTAYVAHAISDTLNLLEVPDELRIRTETALVKAAEHLSRRNEGDFLANHHALALVSLSEVADRAQSSMLKAAAENCRQEFLGLVSPEGWSLEYDGCDIGYNLGTLDFLADMHRRTGAVWIEDCVRKSFSFLSHFAYPDGQWAGALGSRHTSHSYPFALEYWAARLPEARAFLAHQRKALQEGKSLTPAHQEDHYLHYRLADYLKAYSVFFPGDLSGYLLPYEEAGFGGHVFEDAGFELVRSGSLVAWVAHRRGGAFRLYDLEEKKLLVANNGCQVVDGQRKLWSSLWQTPRGESAEAGEGALQPLAIERFGSFTFVAFRMFCLLMRSAWLAYWFKRFIRRALITHRRAGPSWRREFQWKGDGVVVTDSINWVGPKPWQRIVWGGEFHSRYVPQAHYFTPAEAEFAPKEFCPGDFSDPLRPVIEWKYLYQDRSQEICAR